jgi:hypothetical protein
MLTPPYVEEPQPKDPTSEEMESGAEHQEGPKEDAVVKPVKGRKKRHRDRNLATERSGQPEGRGPGELWSAQGIGRRRQKDDPPCRSDTAQGKVRQETFDQGQC